MYLGPYSDFTTGWYGNVGFFLVITFVLSAFGPVVRVHTIRIFAFGFFMCTYGHPCATGLAHEWGVQTYPEKYSDARGEARTNALTPSIPPHQYEIIVINISS